MIQIEALSKKFGDLTILKDISTVIEKGEIISIIGPSGTGKSTFLRCLNLLEKPTSGKIIVDGVNILDKKYDVSLLRRKMGMVFQSFNLFEHLSIIENLTIGPIKILGKSKEEATKRGIDLLKAVGLVEKCYSFPSELSGGQKQRVAIARCLSMDPEVILLDEPTSALDPTMVSEVLGVIRQLAKTGITMLIVTHEMNFAKDVSTRVFYMDEGIIYEDGTPKQIFEHPQKDKTRIFINRIRSLNLSINSRDYDLYRLNSEIELFSGKYFFSQRRSRNLLLITEELLQIAPIRGGVEIEIEYYEKSDTIQYSIIQKNYNRPIINSDTIDELSLSIINGIASEVKEEILDNCVKISILIGE